MRSLEPHLAFDPRETPVSFAARLAALHTGGRMVPFLRDLGLKPDDLRIGANGVTECLAAAAGVDPDALNRNALRATARQRYVLRGEAVTAEFLSSPETVYCPACIKADDAASQGGSGGRVGRLDWTLRAVRTCADHGLALVRKPKRAWDDIYNELAVRAPASGPMLDAEIAQARRRAPSPLQSYVTGRLAGCAGPAWLDSQTLANAVWVAEMLGMVLIHGPKADSARATEDDRDRAGGVGFGYAVRGEAGVRDAMTDIREKHRYAGGKPGPQRIFGRLYTAMASCKAVMDRGDVRQILRDVIFETFEAPAGTVVLCEALPERRLHSAASLATETGLDCRTLRGVLAACGLIPADRSGALHAVFDADEGRALAAGVVRQISLSALPERLNCARPLAVQIVADRLLAPLAGSSGPGVNRTGKAFDETDVIALLADMRDAARTTCAPPPGSCAIAKAAERAKVRGVDILHLILGRHLSQVFRIDGVAGVAGLVVDPDEVKSVAPTLLADLPPAEAFVRLRIPAHSGWALIDTPGPGPSLPARRIAPVAGRHEIVRIRASDVAAFSARYVRIADLTAAHQIERNLVWRKLDQENVKPSVTRRELGVELFDRRTLPTALAF